MERSKRRSEGVLLTIEYSGDGVGEIHFDEEGGELLMDRLSKLLRHKEPEHDHLMTPAWSGWELTEQKKNREADLVHMLNLRFWPAAQQGGER